MHIHRCKGHYSILRILRPTGPVRVTGSMEHWKVKRAACTFIHVSHIYSHPSLLSIFIVPSPSPHMPEYYTIQGSPCRLSAVCLSHANDIHIQCCEPKMWSGSLGSGSCVAASPAYTLRSTSAMSSRGRIRRKTILLPLGERLVLRECGLVCSTLPPVLIASDLGAAQHLPRQRERFFLCECGPVCSALPTVLIASG